VSRGEDALGQDREACRAVEEHQVVFRAERLEESRYDAFWLPEIEEHPVELSIREIRRQQIEIAVVSLLDRRAQRRAAPEALLAKPLDVGPYPKGEAGCGLRIQVPEQDPVAARRRE